MPRVTILQRSLTVHFPEARQAVEVVEVTFVTDADGVRSVALPFEAYRRATEEELDANPRYHMLPVDKAAEDTERKRIEAALKRAAANGPVSFDLP